MKEIEYRKIQDTGKETFEQIQQRLQDRQRRIREIEEFGG